MSLCDFSERVVVYKGYGNTISVIPIANIKTNEKIDMTAATEAIVCIGSTTASSTDDPSYIWWDQDDDEEWVIHFKPGMFTGVPVGEQDASIIVFGGEYTHGLVLTSSYPLDIKEIC
jgi:hypothetical protein